MDIDARGPRFGAIITTIVLAIALVTGSMWLLLAQTLVFAVGVIGYAVGITGIGVAFTAMALAAAFLNAAFDFCLGCQMYLFIRRISPSSRGNAPA